MIKLDFDNDFHQMEYMPLTEITDKLIHIHYPQLRFRLNQIEDSLCSLNTSNKAAEKAILIKIRQELNSLIEKERLLIFPLLLILQKERRQTDCSPFKLAKKHYQSLISCMQGLKLMLHSDNCEQELMPVIIQQIDDFEKNVIQLQRTKEKNLFAPFKNCNNNCKIKPDDSHR